jgi:hypothetical protein
MKIEMTCVITLDERDGQAMAVNGGTPVELPPNTTRVILRSARMEKEPSDKKA